MSQLRVRFICFVHAIVLGSFLDTPKLKAQEAKPSAREELVNRLAMIFEPRAYVGTNKFVLNYRLLKPVDYIHGKKYPLIVFLHGAGERGDDNKTTLIHGAKDFSDKARREKFPCYVVIPQCPKDMKWSEVDWTREASELPKEPSQSLRATKELLDEMIENAGVDATRVYITGLSMGGYGTWDAIARYPKYFAAAVPICGGGDPNTVVSFPRLPIWCFHGDADSAVKVKRSREMIEALQKVGSPAKYTEYPGVGHDSWTATYSNPALYEWLFSQQRASEQ